MSPVFGLVGPPGPLPVPPLPLYKRKNGSGRIGIPAFNCSHCKHVGQPTGEYVHLPVFPVQAVKFAGLFRNESFEIKLFNLNKY